MPSKKLVLKTYLSAEEHAQVSEQAARARMSLSAFAKHMCLHGQVHGLDRQQAILELLKTRADLGRLGGLFKLALTQSGNYSTIEIRQLLRNIEAMQKEIISKIKDM
jgi:hypothetical protein